MIEINKEKDSGGVRIDVKGEVDASSSIHLDNAIEEALKEDNKIILINLTQLEYISSAGLGVFISRLEELKEKQIQMVLYGLSSGVREVFEILGLEKLLTMKSTHEEAVASLNEA